MAPLPSNLRRDLERTIVRAREIAEQGSREAIEALTVHEGKRGSHVTSDADIVLRNHLRARAQQIGDRRNSQSKAQAIGRLVQECAYEQWHRMIFARFLAENSLLVEPESQVPVSLEDVEELARDEGIDRWELAGQYAQQSLPAIFRSDDPLLQVQLPREIRLQLDALLDELPRETFLADDSLGWVYQFWQSAEKERIDKEGEKITGDTLSAVTQLFTEHYMVLFLLHNTIGAWHAGKVLAERPDLANSAKSEAELREALRLTEAGGYDFEYLRFVRSTSPSPSQGEGRGEGSSDDDTDVEPTGPRRPMGGTFDGWPKRASELKVLDPCCGSGHFLVAAFELLVRLRMYEEGLSIKSAIDAVIQDNLFGLELDPRCTQIAAFNLALAAWKLTGPRVLPAMNNVACTGLSLGVSRDQWMEALESDGTSNLRFYFGQLYDMFSNASALGSLINPNRFLGSHILKADETDRLFRSLEAGLHSDAATAPERHELGIAAQGTARAAKLLADKYHVVLTNVPFLGRGKQFDVLRDHIDTYYEYGKADLATAFVLRCNEFCGVGGTLGVVTPQNWLFLTTYQAMRERLLEYAQWDFVVRLGPNAFQEMNWWAATTALVAITSTTPTDTQTVRGIDVSSDKRQEVKADMLRGALGVSIQESLQSSQFHNPDSRVIIGIDHTANPLYELASITTGLQTGDNDQYAFYFWELPQVRGPWEFFHRTADATGLFRGRTRILRWENGNGSLTRNDGARIQGLDCRGRTGILIHRMNELPVTIFSGDLFDQNGAVLIPNDDALLAPMWCYLSSDQYRTDVRVLDTKTGVTPTTLVKVPFETEHWIKQAKAKFPNGIPLPESDDPTQWLFHGSPSKDAKSLHVALSRFLGYRWPAELDPDMRLSDHARQLVQSCDELLPFADEDGIVCIPSVRGEDTAAARLTRLLEACNLKPPHKLDDWLRNDFFKEHCDLFQQRPFIWHIWDGRKADGFHALVNYHKLVGRSPELVPGQQARSSELVPSQQSHSSELVPGQRERSNQGLISNGGTGNSEQVPSYELGHSGRKLLENLTYSYLGDWINRQESDVKRGESGADGRLAAAKTLQERLVAILKGEPPYDIFVRWKPLHEQPIGWNPDINDGVRMNIRPFMAVDIPGGRKGAGILRWGPKVKWTKDRGKEPKRPRDEYPWFWSWDEQTTDFPGTDTFTGDRWNDCHYTNAFKQAARVKK